MTPTRKFTVKEEEASQESPVVAQKRKSDTPISETGIKKLNHHRKKSFVATALYRVSMYYNRRDNSSNKFEVAKGEVVKFIRHCELGTGDPNPDYVEVMNQKQQTGFIHEGALDEKIVPRMCPCSPVQFIEEKRYLDHQVLEHYYWALYSYLEALELNRSSTSTLICPVINCHETFPDLQSLMLHYGSLPHARVLILQQFDSNDSKWLPIFRTLDRMDSDMLCMKKRSDEMEKEKILKEQMLQKEKEKQIQSEKMVNKLKEEVERVLKEKAEVELKLNSLSNQFQAMKKERDSLDDKSEQFRMELESLRKEHDEKSTKLDYRDAELLNLKGKMEKLGKLQESTEKENQKCEKLRSREKKESEQTEYEDEGS